MSHAMHHVRQRGALAVGMSLALALGIALAVLGWRHQSLRVEFAEARTAWAGERAAAAAAAASASESYRNTEAQLRAALQENADAARQDLDRARRDAAAARVSAGRLRDAAAVAAAACSGGAAVDPAAAPGSAPAAGPGVLLADVLVLVEEAGRAMAEEADKRGIAGATCEADADAIRKRLNRAAGVQSSFGVEIHGMRLLSSLVSAKAQLNVSSVKGGTNSRGELSGSTSGHAEKPDDAIGAGAAQVFVVDGHGHVAEIGPAVVAPVAVDVVDGSRPLASHVEPSEPMGFVVATRDVDAHVAALVRAAGLPAAVEPSPADERREDPSLGVVGNELPDGRGRKIHGSHDALQLLIGQRSAVDLHSLRASSFWAVCPDSATNLNAGVACERAYDTLTRTQEITP